MPPDFPQLRTKAHRLAGQVAGMGLPCINQRITNQRAGAMGGELFSESGLHRFYLREGFLPMTKSIALSLVLAASLGLAACSGGAENAANNAANSAENASNAADNAMNAALNAADNAANAASNATNNVANAM
jgi:hypothetical protein